METSLKNVLLDAFWIMPATPKYKNQGLPYITSKNIKNRRIDFNDVKYIDEADYDVISRNRPILENDILISMIGTLGEVAVVKKEDGRFYGQNMYLIRLDESKVSQKYFLNWVESDAVKRAILQQQNKSTQSYLKAEHVEGLSIKLPSVDEQNRIADIFERINQLTENRKQQLQKLDELVKARFVEMFGEPIANTLVLPMKTLKELSVLITNGNTPKGGSENYVDKGILFLRSQNVWRNRIDLDDVAYIDENTHYNMRKSSLKHKDILITKTGRINTENSSLGRAALFLGDDDSANINGHVYLVRLKDSVVPEYVITILASEAYRKYIRKVCVGGIDKRQINLDQVEDFPIILPDYGKQVEFSNFIQQINKSKLHVQKSLDKLEILKKALMQKYFG